MRLGFEVKRLFFDRKAVMNALDRGARRALSRAGAFIRTAARSSIRSRRTSSKPGAPPHSHTGLLKRFLFFSYDSAQRSVVVGPAKLNRGSGAPKVLEHGGRATIQSWNPKTK